MLYISLLRNGSLAQAQVIIGARALLLILIDAPLSRRSRYTLAFFVAHRILQPSF
jgi:hypothetical protein